MEAAVFSRDFLSMLGISLVLCVFMVWGKNAIIGRGAGTILLLLYAGYYTLLI